VSPAVAILRVRFGSRAAVHEGKVASSHHPAGRNHPDPLYAVWSGWAPSIHETAGSGSVVKLVKLPAFRPYARGRTRTRTPQTYRSSPTSPRGADCTIRPHKTCGNQRAMPCHDAVAGARGVLQRQGHHRRGQQGGACSIPLRNCSSIRTLAVMRDKLRPPRMASPGRR